MFLATLMVVIQVEGLLNTVFLPYQDRNKIYVHSILLNLTFKITLSFLLLLMDRKKYNNEIMAQNIKFTNKTFEKEAYIILGFNFMNLSK